MKMGGIVIIVTAMLLLLKELIIKDRKTRLNLKIIFQTVEIIVGVACILVYYIFQSILNLSITNSTMIIIITFTFGILFIVGLLILKEVLFEALRIVDYYIHRKKVLKNGQFERVSVIDVEEDGAGKGFWGERKYRFVVEFNGKKLRSIWFLGKAYSKTKTIDVVSYKNRSYIALKDEIEKFKR